MKSEQPKQTALVTGAFSLTGKRIAERLLACGWRVRTLTGHPGRADGASPIDVHPYAWDDPATLAAAFDGVDTFYNTYWVRLERGPTSFASAVAHTKLLFHCARDAGVRRVVHVSIANATASQDLPYYRGKAACEEHLAATGLAYAIVRPTVLFGDGGILIGNIAWLLRRFPVFAIAGRGDYRLRPVFVDDLAELAVSLGNGPGTTTIDAVGPDAFAFLELVQHIRAAVGSRAILARVPTGISLAAAAFIGRMVSDVLVTRDELRGLQRGLLDTTGPATCPTGLGDWLRANGDTLGAGYQSELARHYRAPDGAS